MKKLISLFIIIATLFSLVACGGGGDPPIGPPGDPVPEPVEDADLLLYSFNRIENADLSFNMSMNGVPSSTAAFSSTVTPCAADDRVIIENPDELAWVDFFESEESALSTVRDQARQVCDFVLERVTVVNKIVHEGGMNYLLQYEGEDDVLTVYSFYGGVDGDSLEKVEEEEDPNVQKGEHYVDPNEITLEGKVRDLLRIQFYYDEDGDETVSYLNYGIHYDSFFDAYSLNSMEVVYTPGKHYEIKNYTCTVDKETLEKDGEVDFIHVTVADNSTGKWQGISWYGNSSSPYFTKEGEYDVNDNVLINFIFETDEGLMQLNGAIRAYRDGYMINSGEALETDEIRLVINQQVSELFWINIADNGFIFSLSLANIDGWDRVVIDPSDEFEQYHCYLRGNDYVEFSNGKTLYGSDTNRTVWIDDFGFVYIRVNESNLIYVDENGVEHDADWFNSVGGNDYSRIIAFNGETYLNPETGSASTFFLDAEIVTSIYNPMVPDIPVCEDAFGLMKRFFEYAGLSSKLQPDLDKTFAATVLVYENREKYMDALFLDWNGVTFSYESFVDYIFDTFAAYCERLDAYNGFVSDYEAVDISMIPKMPENLALIAISDGVSGSVSVGESGFDFSAMSAAIEKNILLGDQNEYTVAAVLVGKTPNEIVGAFAAVRYANSDMTVSGNSDVALPTELSEGEYTLAIYFGRKTEGGVARLSELITPALESFTAFERRVDATDGYFIYRYFEEGGVLRISVGFTDTAAPAIMVEGSEIVDDRLTVGFSIGACVGDLVAAVSSLDNRDGALIVTADNIKRMDSADGTAVTSADALATGETYRITVSDTSGNESFVSVVIALN